MSQAFKKIQAIGREFGLDVGAQGTTQNLYQDIPVIAGQTNYDFFSTPQLSPNSLRTNVTDNQLQIGQFCGVFAISFRITNATTELYDIALSRNHLLNSKFTFKIGNSTVMANNFLIQDGAVGMAGKANNNNFVFLFESFITIPPLTNFEVSIQLPRPVTIPALTDLLIGCDLWAQGTYPGGTY